MNLTNRYGLPEAIVEAARRHEHRSGDYSASMLADSPRQVWLRKRHEDELVEDVADRMWALLGSAFHAVAAAGSGAHELAEEYLEATFLGRTVSGTSDLYDTREEGIDDYKTTTIRTLQNARRIAEWTKQLNVYGLLRRLKGFAVRRLRTVVVLRDWMASRARGGGYPPCQVAVFDLPLWTEEEQRAYVEDRVATFEIFRDTPDDQLPLCTDEERWDDGAGPKRCDVYCPAVRFCNQRQAELGGTPMMVIDEVAPVTPEQFDAVIDRMTAAATSSQLRALVQMAERKGVPVADLLASSGSPGVDRITFDMADKILNTPN